MHTTPGPTALNELLNELTARDDDCLWITFDENGPISLHVGPEPEFSQDEGLVQINLSAFFRPVLKNDLFRHIYHTIKLQSAGVITPEEALQEIEVAIHG